MKIQDLLRQVDPCWKYAVMDENKRWRCYTDKSKSDRCDSEEQQDFDTYESFDIEPFEDG